jgi:SAM-dependent methyltransferase
VGYLTRVFTATEEENRRAVLAALPNGHGGALLDLGVSDGEFTLRVAERVHANSVQGVELLAEHAERARARGVDTVLGDVEEGLPFEDQSFDIVHSNQLIEHLRRTDVFLSEIRRVLKPSGLACISTNNLASWHNVILLALGMQPAPMHVSDEVIVGNPLNPEQGAGHADRGRIHVRLFTGRALCELCAFHGLRRKELRTAGYYPLPPRLARAALKIDPLHGAYLIGLFSPDGATA